MLLILIVLCYFKVVRFQSKMGVNASARHNLVEIMDDRYEQSATLIISQLPTEQWYKSIGNNSLVDAILDRLRHNAHRMNLQGESMRKNEFLDPS